MTSAFHQKQQAVHTSLGINLFKKIRGKAAYYNLS